MAKNALCIGINDYPGTDSDLSGCVNDAHDWAAVLQGYGFNVSTLIDEQATREAMLGAIGNLIGSAQSGDTVVLTYSGHGTWLEDTDGDEPDARDEALCPGISPRPDRCSTMISTVCSIPAPPMCACC
ncbi:caspase family protein [Azotobacter chroococcum]